MTDANLEKPGSPVNIEPATWHDLNPLRHLEQVCFPKDAWPLIDLVGILAFPNVVRLKASFDNKMVGFIAADIKRGENLAWIATIGVLPEFRGRGIGTTLMRACESKLDIKWIKLCVRSNNTVAIWLYEQFDYHHVETWQRYYSDGEDALVFEKEL